MAPFWTSRTISKDPKSAWKKGSIGHTNPFQSNKFNSIDFTKMKTEYIIEEKIIISCRDTHKELKQYVDKVTDGPSLWTAKALYGLNIY